MSASLVVVLASTAALANAAVGGITYGFSTFVMHGLDRTDPVDAITAKRAINAEANSNVAFLLVVSAAAILALVLGIVGATQLHQPGSWWLLVGGIFGVIAAIITLGFNVPLNNRLGGVDPAQLSSDDAAREWRAYFSSWMTWNHARTVAAFLSAALILVGLRYS